MDTVQGDIIPIADVDEPTRRSRLAVGEFARWGGPNQGHGGDGMRHDWIRQAITADLIADREALLWVYAELQLDGTGGSDDYLDHAIKEITKEIDRRSRLRLSAHAPAWPNKPDKGLRDRVRAAHPLADFVARYGGIELRRQGDRLVAKCPLGTHRDSDASFTVYPDGHWHCYGCHETGDVFSFAMRVLGTGTFRQTLAHLAHLAGIDAKGV